MPTFQFRNGRDVAPADFKELTNLQKQQLLYTMSDKAEEYEKALKQGLDKALRKMWKEQDAELCEFWQVVDTEQNNVPLYDFWCWNVDTGTVFHTGTMEYTQIAMIQGYFDPQVVNPPDDLEELAQDLDEAFKSKPKYRQSVSMCACNEAGEVVGFAEGAILPTEVRQWNHFLAENKVTESFILAYQAHFNKKSWELVSRYAVLSEGFMRKWAKKLSWKNLCQYQSLPENFIREFQNTVDWLYVSFKQPLSEAFIEEFQDKINWDYASSSQRLSEDFLRRFEHKIEWSAASWGQKLSEDFIREFQDKINWQNLCMYQNLSEDFLREFQDKVDWHYVSGKQIMSVDFIRAFKAKINFVAFSHNPSLTPEIVDAFSDEISWSSLAYFNVAKRAEIFTEARLQQLRVRYPQRAFWKEILSHLKHFSKECKGEFLRKCKD